jgi:hypothetical protein
VLERAVVMACFAAASTGGAAAPDQGKIVRFPSAAPPELPADVRQKIDRAVDTALAEAGYTVVQAPSCADEACRTAALEEAGAGASVGVSVGAVGSDYRIEVQVVDADGGVASTKEGVCEICRHEEVVAKVGTLVAEASAEAAPAEEAEPEAETGTVAVLSNPKGATVILDGRSIGTAPVTTEVAPGTHTLRLEHKGYEPTERTIEVAAGATVDEAIELSRKQVIAPQTEIVIGWVALGVGVAAVATGAALVAIDENPIKSECTGANVDANGVCKFRYNTIGGGVAALVIGLAATGTGVGFLVHGYRSRGRTGEVAVGPGSLTWRF